jgi:hypothetical protein
MKTCVSCKFSKFDSHYFRWACTRKHKPDVEVPDVIAGGIKRVPQTPSEDHMVDCKVERSKRLFGCGPKGKHHQERYPQ